MSEPGSGAIVFFTRASGALAVLACGLLGWAVVSSIGVPNFSIGRFFISELAVPHNPAAARLNASFMVAGAMMLPMMLLLSRRSRWPASRKAAIAGALGAVALSLVGVFPLSHENLQIHYGLAVALALTCIASGLVLGRGLGQALRLGDAEGMTKLALRSGRLLVWLQLLCVAAALGVVVWATVKASPGSIKEWWYTLPRHLYWRRGQMLLNPLACLEWIYFALTAALLAGAGVFTLVRRPSGADQASG